MVSRFDRESAPSAGWFSRLGAPLSDQEREHVRAMLQALHFAPRAEVVSIGAWSGVGAVLRAEERDSRAWDAEEAERERLWAAAADRMPESDLLEALHAGQQALREAIHAAAGLAAVRYGAGDPAMIAEAAGAALLAAHQRQLAVLAGVDHAHYFERKFGLFKGGRWPLGMCDGRFVIF